MPIERMVADFRGASRWPAASGVEAAVKDGPPETAAAIRSPAALAVRGGHRRGDFPRLHGHTKIRRCWTVGGLHLHTIPKPMGRRQARCVIMRACEALFFCPELFFT